MNVNKTEEPKWTHKGWMLFCPVKFVEPYSEAPIVAARWVALEPLLTVAHVLQTLVISLCSMTSPDYEPHFYFKVTGELSIKTPDRQLPRRGGCEK